MIISDFNHIKYFIFQTDGTDIIFPEMGNKIFPGDFAI